MYSVTSFGGMFGCCDAMIDGADDGAKRAAAEASKWDDNVLFN